MSFSDITMPFVVASVIFLAFVGGCDRLRLSFLEDDNREYRKRILKLETDVMFLEKWIKKVEAHK